MLLVWNIIFHRAVRIDLQKYKSLSKFQLQISGLLLKFHEQRISEAKWFDIANVYKLFINFAL